MCQNSNPAHSQMLFSDRYSICSLQYINSLRGFFVVKELSSSEQSVGEILKREFELASKLSKGVMTPVEIQTPETGLKAVYRDFGGRPLSWTIGEAYKNPFLVASIAFQLAHILEQLHGLYESVGFLSPDMIFLNSKSLEVRLLCPGFYNESPVSGHDFARTRLSAGYL